MRKTMSVLCAFALLLALCGAGEKNDLLVLNADEQTLYHYENETLVDSYPCAAQISAEDMGAWRFAGCEGQCVLLESETGAYRVQMLAQDAQTLQKTVKTGSCVLVERDAAATWTEGRFFE